MPHVELTEKQLILAKIIELLRDHDSAGQPPSNEFLLELHINLSSLNEKYPETVISPLSKKSRKILEEFNIKYVLTLQKKIRDKLSRKNRKKQKSEEKISSEQKNKKSGDLLDSRLLYKGNFESGKRR